MKKFLILAAFSSFIGCSTITPTQTDWLKQAFGNYIRSIEGQATLDAVPALVIAGRDKWLPKGAYWDSLAATVIREYIAANPKNDVELNKELEQIAVQLNTARL